MAFWRKNNRIEARLHARSAYVKNATLIALPVVFTVANEYSPVEEASR
jgi:hypothetical protein